MNFRIGDVVRCRGQLAVVIAHKLYDAERDGYVLEYLDKSVLRSGRRERVVLPENLTLVSSSQKNEKGG
jgi:hypothetical protein